jgi:hypothetical protein
VVHALDCNKVRGYTWASRHALVKKVLKNVLRQYGFLPDNREPRFNGVGPDVCFLLGTTLIIVDVSVVNPLADSYVTAEAQAAGATLAAAEDRKNDRHVAPAEARKMTFYPLVISTFGTPSSRSLTLLRKCAMYTANPTGFMTHMCSALAVAVQIGNARIVMAATTKWWEYGVR